MIDNTTPDRIAALGATIASAAEEMERTFRELSTVADAQLAAAAAAFIAEHGDTSKGPLYASYAEAHAALLKASVAAANIRELGQRSTTLRSKCGWWTGLNGRGQQAGDIRHVCAIATPPACDSDATADRATATGAAVPVATDRQATE